MNINTIIEILNSSDRNDVLFGEALFNQLDKDDKKCIIITLTQKYPQNGRGWKRWIKYKSTSRRQNNEPIAIFNNNFKPNEGVDKWIHYITLCTVEGTPWKDNDSTHWEY